MQSVSLRTQIENHKSSFLDPEPYGAECLPSHGPGVQETHRWGKQQTIDSFMSAGGNQQIEGGGEALLAGADGGEGQTMIKDYMKMMSQGEGHADQS